LDELSKLDRRIFSATIGCRSGLTELDRISYNQIYDRVRLALKALGLTVLANPDITDDILSFDEQLLLSSIEFKKWFFRSCFSHPEKRGSRYYWPGVDRTIVLLKRLGAWMVYYSSFELDLNDPPRIGDALPGSGIKFQTFTWFSGGLSKYREPWRMSPTKTNVLGLSQISGFGRALPPPSKEYALVQAHDTYNVLTTKVEVPDFWLRAFRIATERIINRLPKKEVNTTHCSINATACYERTTEEGGNASEIVTGVNEFLKRDISSQLFSCKYNLYDPLGVIAIPADRYFSDGNFSLEDLIEQEFMPKFGNILYKGNRRKMPNSTLKVAWTDEEEVFNVKARKEAGDPISEDTIESLGDIEYLGFHYGLQTEFGRDYVSYNDTLGHIVALWAFTKALEYGQFVDETGTPLIPFEGMALFRTKPHEWVQNKNVPAKFMALEEPGFKIRALTKNCSWVVIIQSLLRHPVSDILSQDPRIGLGLKSSYIMWDFLKRIKNRVFPEDIYLINTDLQSATDRITHGLLSSIWKGAFSQLGWLRPRSPYSCLTGFAMINHDLEWKTKDIDLKKPHLCGSFMGEPISFMGLSLFNECVEEIAMHITHMGLMRSKFDLNIFMLNPMVPTMASANVGDDKHLLETKEFYLNLNWVYTCVNAKPSPGKNTISQVHGTLAENHTYMQNGIVSYLDTIKFKLLTESARHHGDNRSSILGKGANLYQQLSWYEETTPPEQRFCAMSARFLYTKILKQNVYPRDFNRAMSLPIGLPPSAAGISFPVGFNYLKRNFPYELNFLWWLVDKAPIDQFMAYVCLMMDTTGRMKRALETPSFANIWQGQVSTVLKKVLEIPRGEKFDPQVNTSLVSLQHVLLYIKDNHPEIEISKTTGFPHVVASLKLIFEEYGYISLESLDSLLERSQTFLKAFKEGVTKSNHMSFSRYVTNLSRFWDHVRSQTSHIEMSDHKFRSLDDIHWRISKKKMILVHKDVLGSHALTHGPTLFLELRRIPVTSIEVLGRTTASDTVTAFADNYIDSLRPIDDEQLIAVMDDI
jgi:hypothetical protein